MNRFSLALVFGLCVGTVNSTRAATLYSQTTPDEPIAAFASNDSLPTSQRVADNFLLTGPSPLTVRSLRFIGGDGLLDPMSDAFRVVFLEDAGGIPGSTLSGGDFSIGSAFSSVSTGGQLLNGVTIPREYIINLPGGISLSPNTTYWLSITNDLLPASGWAWARADGVLDQNLASTFNIESGPWGVFTSGGMWFDLNDHIVPEPSSLVILLVASMTMALPRLHFAATSNIAEACYV